MHERYRERLAPFPGRPEARRARRSLRAEDMHASGRREGARPAPSRGEVHAGVEVGEDGEVAERQVGSMDDLASGPPSVPKRAMP